MVFGKQEFQTRMYLEEPKIESMEGIDFTQKEEKLGRVPQELMRQEEIIKHLYAIMDLVQAKLDPILKMDTAKEQVPVSDSLAPSVNSVLSNKLATNNDQIELITRRLNLLLSRIDL